jgi:hypothetical protein
MDTYSHTHTGAHIGRYASKQAYISMDAHTPRCTHWHRLRCTQGYVLTEGLTETEFGGLIY